MLKLMMLLVLSFSVANAKSSVGACIPIGQVVTLKKSIMNLDLDKNQKKSLVVFEEKLKTDLEEIKEKSKHSHETLSSLFDKNKFLPQKFALLTTKKNDALTKVIGEYFTKMYSVLTKKQKEKLIKRFKRIERKRNK